MALSPYLVGSVYVAEQRDGDREYGQVEAAAMPFVASGDGQCRLFSNSNFRIQVPEYVPHRVDAEPFRSEKSQTASIEQEQHRSTRLCRIRSVEASS